MALRPICKTWEKNLDRVLCILVVGTSLVRDRCEKGKHVVLLGLGPLWQKIGSQILMKQPTCGDKIHQSQMKSTT